MSTRDRRTVRRTLVGLLASFSLAGFPALASATVFEGSQTDPAGDVVIAALPSVDLPNGGPTRIGFGSMDLSGASVTYDSARGLLSITFNGSNFVYTHSGTSFYGAIYSAAHQGSDQCRSASDNLYFTGTSGTGSGGGPGHGTATLNISVPGSDLTKSITGTVSFPVDFPEHNQVATFTFLDTGLVNHAYLCAAYLGANYADHGDRNSDSIRPFCIVAGCFDPLESAAPPPVGPSLVSPSMGGVTTSGSPDSPGGGVRQETSTNARCSILPGKIRATTARMRLMQRASRKGSASHRRAVTRQVRVLASRRTTQWATYKALCT